MATTTTPGRTPASILTGLLLAALGASDGYDYVQVPGLPLPALHVPERDALIAVTMSASPLVDLEVVAGEQRLDVVLLHLGDTGPDGAIGVDVALGSLPCAVWAERGLTVYIDSTSLWLVPELFGPAVSVTRDGFCLELVPPYATTAERERGVTRADLAVSAILQPAEVR